MACFNTYLTAALKSYAPSQGQIGCCFRVQWHEVSTRQAVLAADALLGVM